MLGLVGVFGVWILGAVAVLASDRGTREHLAMRFRSDELTSTIVAEQGRGTAIDDVRELASDSRHLYRKLLAARMVLLLAAVVLTAMLPFPQVAVATAGAFVVVMTGGRGRFQLALRGISDPSVVRTFRGRLVDAVGYTVKIAVASVGVLLLARSWDLVDARRWYWAIGSLAAGWIALWWAHLPARALLRLTRSWVTPGPSGFGVSSNRESILLLRSFGDDRARILTPVVAGGPSHPLLGGTRERFEELLSASVIVNEAQLVAIGRPGERLPELGAARTYYPDADWQDAVRTTAARCSAVLLIAGNSDGLAWEIDHLKQWGLLNKVLIVLPPERDPDVARARLEHCVGRLDPAGQVPIGWNRSMWLAVTVRNGVVHHLVGEGRDWAAFVTTVILFLAHMSGDIQAFTSGQTAAGMPGAERGLDRLAAARTVRVRPGQATKLIRQLQQAYRAISEQDFPRASALFGTAEQTAHAYGLEGAAVGLASLHADELRESGRMDAAAELYERVAVACERGFPKVSLGPALPTWSASDLEIDALHHLAKYAAEGHGDPLAAHIRWHASLVRARDWANAGEIAKVVGRNQKTVAGANEWFERAHDELAGIGAQDAAADLQQEWGDRLAALGDRVRGADHLRQAVELFERAGRPDRAEEAATKLTQVLSALARADAAPGLRRGFFDRFSNGARLLVVRAKDAAVENRNPNIEPAHLVIGLAHSSGVAAELLVQAGVELLEMADLAAGTLEPPDNTIPDDAWRPFSEAARQVLKGAVRIADAQGSDVITTLHIGVSLLEAYERAGRPDRAEEAATKLTQVLSALARADAAPGLRRGFFDRFSNGARLLVVRAKDAAVENRNPNIEPAHLVIGLAHSSGVAAELLVQAGVELLEMADLAAGTLEPPDNTIPDDAWRPFTEATRQVLKGAVRIADTQGSDAITTLHIGVSVLEAGGAAGEVLRQCGADRAWTPDSEDEVTDVVPITASSRSPVPFPNGHRSVDWSLGWGTGWPSPPDPQERPPGLADDGLTDARRHAIRRTIASTYRLPKPILARIISRLEQRAIADGTPGVALTLQEVRGSILIHAGRVGEGVAVLRDILQHPEPGWITLDDDPVTGAELFDGVLGALGDALSDADEHTGRVGIERQRLELAPRLRDPRATWYAYARLGYALALAGEYDEAEEWFERTVAENDPENHLHFMRAANSLHRGRPDEAVEYLAHAMAKGDTNYPGAWGVRGDVLAATGDLEAAAACYRRGLEIASEGYLKDYPEMRRHQSRLSELGL